MVISSTKCRKIPSTKADDGLRNNKYEHSAKYLGTAAPPNESGKPQNRTLKQKKLHQIYYCDFDARSCKFIYRQRCVSSKTAISCSFKAPWKTGFRFLSLFPQNRHYFLLTVEQTLRIQAKEHCSVSCILASVARNTVRCAEVNDQVSKHSHWPWAPCRSTQPKSFRMKTLRNHARLSNCKYYQLVWQSLQFRTIMWFFSRKAPF